MAMVFRSAKNLENQKKIDKNNKISLNKDIIEKYLIDFQITKAVIECQKKCILIIKELLSVH